LHPEAERVSLEALGHDIHARLEPLTVVIHPHDSALAWEGDDTWIVPTHFIEKPILSTGGGDTFNAGLCAGFLLDLPMESCLACANAGASYYITFGESPTPAGLADYVQRHRESFVRASRPREDA
jgi:sugar/nucleoside kinase (ribokinase family)